MSNVIQDTTNQFDTRHMRFREESLSLESICQELDLILDHHQGILSLESFYGPVLDYRDEMNPFLDIGMEEVREDTAHTSATGGLGAVAEGLARKTLRGAGNVIKATPDAVVKVGGKIGLNLAKLAKAFIDKMATFINTISMGLSKTFATGYPLMEALVKQANTIKHSLNSSRSINQPGFELKKAYVLSIDGKMPEPKEIIDNLHYINEIQKTILSRQKLENFKDISSAFLEPYRNTMEKHKVDPLVMAMAVIGLLTNPGQVAGAILKKLFSAANPNLGEEAEITATVSGGLLTGTAGLILGMGNSSASVMKQLQLGKLNISSIPKFQAIYPFCDTEEKDADELLSIFKSRVLLGNYQWVCKDYKDVIQEGTKGSVGRVGGKFISIKEELDTNTVKTLSPREAGEICDTVISVLANAQAYCKQWPAYAKTYNALYNEIGKIVMNMDSKDSDGDFDVVVPYVRYSYRNALNVMLGSIWKNCFGSDNTFIRYLVTTCRLLLQYCQQSLEAGEATEEDNNAEAES